MAEARAPVTPALRRYVTLLFSDLSESARLSGAIEAEHYAAVLDHLRDLYDRVVRRHGGTVARIQGDGVLAIFGHPEPMEDDGRKAVEAALDLHRAVREARFHPPLPWPQLTLHSGVHAGLVLIAEGDLVRGRFELLGVAPNIAARLSDAARADEILVSEETLGPESHLFVTAARRELGLSGIAAPVAVLSILGRAGPGTRFDAQRRRGLSPFRGRRSELESLRAGLRSALAGRPALAVLTGSAGIGKTRLAEEFLRDAALQGSEVHRGYCENHLIAEPLQPWLLILRAMVGITHEATPGDAADRVAGLLPADDAAMAAHVGELQRLLSVDRPDAGAAARAPSVSGGVAALRALFATRATRQPLVLFIDDWQWADDTSRQVLDAVRDLHDSAIFVFVATRVMTLGGGLAQAHVIETPPLADVEATDSIEHLLPGADPFLRAEIRSYAGGNPLFIEELCHSAANAARRAQGAQAPTGAAWLNVLIESRVTRLPPAQVSLVQSAAVIGNVIPTWLLERITGVPAGDERLQGLAQEDLVFPGEHEGTLRFKHGITRDVIYGAVGLHRRQELHRAIAEALLERAGPAAEDEFCESLAYHYGAAGLSEQAARFAERAGDKAMAASALDRAKAQYRACLAALDALAPSPAVLARWAAMAQRLALACVFDASADELVVFERAVAMAEASGNATMVAWSRYWLSYVNYALGASRAAVEHGRRALEAAERIGDDRLAAQVRATLGQAHAAAASYDEAIRLLDEAIAVKQRYRRGAGLAVGTAYSLCCKAAVLGDRGQFGDAQALFDEALVPVRGSGHQIEASILGLQAAVLLWQGRWADADAGAAEGARVGEKVRSMFSFAMNRAVGAYGRSMLRAEPESMRVLVESTQWLAQRRGGLFHSLNHGWLCDMLARSGTRAQARGHAALALRRARDERDLIGAAMACRAMARLAGADHDRRAATRWLRRADGIAAARQSAHEAAVNRLCEGELALAFDDNAGARASLDEAAAAFERLAMRWHLAQTLALIG